MTLFRRFFPSITVLFNAPIIAVMQRIIGVFVLFLSVVLITPNVSATVLMLDKQAEIRTDYPQKYTVKEGDSLWDLISLFVKRPGRINMSAWADVNIYPGNQVSLVERAGHPALQVRRGQRVVKLSPGVVTARAERNIPKIPLSSIRQFLDHPEIVEAEELSGAPYIVANANDKLMMTAGDVIYARGVDGSEYLGQTFTVLRPSEAYFDRGSEDDGDTPVAYGALYLGEASLEVLGDEDDGDNVVTLKLLIAKQDILAGDRLLPTPDREFEQDFTPSTPDDVENTRIIGVAGAGSHIGQYQVVLINRGLEDGFKRGNVLAVYHNGQNTRDPMTNEILRLPSVQTGTVLVFKVYERVSFALVRSATQPIFIGDSLGLP